ncbi:MAG: hypothetical protein M1823_001303 [Watsoniomyces obsoletus]|nr:MAG: hypothetical protein M1823_001303 [Watsoniomyces obsoletus]
MSLSTPPSHRAISNLTTPPHSSVRSRSGSRGPSAAAASSHSLRDASQSRERPPLNRLGSSSGRISTLSSTQGASETQALNGGRQWTVPRATSPLGTIPLTSKGKRTWKDAWVRNKGMALVLIAQFFGALMITMTRLLETEGEGLHPLQVLTVRMVITVVLSCAYMWYTKVPDYPLGKPEVRGLLVLRGFGGFFGVFGLYYSLLYLPIAEATVLTFLAPGVACWACSFLLREPFTRTEQLAGLVSVIGVTLIARPTLIFGSSQPSTIGSGTGDGLPITDGPNVGSDPDRVTPTQRFNAVCLAMLGVAGAACAYTCIRWIGKRAHPLISVNYFAVWCTIISVVSLLTIPSIGGFKAPASPKLWLYLLIVGACGFTTQILLTAGLQHEKSSRATNMIYSAMLYAIVFDKIVWGTTPSSLSILGSILILGSAICVAVRKQSPPKPDDDTPVRATVSDLRVAIHRSNPHRHQHRPSDEERALVLDGAEDEETDHDDLQDLVDEDISNDATHSSPLAKHAPLSPDISPVQNGLPLKTFHTSTSTSNQ